MTPGSSEPLPDVVVHHERCRGRSARRPNGYALLVTVVLLALMGVILGGLARRSADAALQARAAEDDLRQRWAELSCRRSLLATAPARFEARQAAWLEALADEDRGFQAAAQPPPRFEALDLGLIGLRVLVRVDDEQAKININATLREAPATLLDPAQPATDLLGAYTASRPRLTRPDIAAALGLEPLEGWRQALPDTTPLQLLGLYRADDLLGEPNPRSPAGALTLWGDGTLNLYTADDDAIHQRLRDQVSTGSIGAFLDLRRNEPELLAGAGLHGLIDNATEDRSERVAMQSLLTDRSRTYALWLSISPTPGSPGSPGSPGTSGNRMNRDRSDAAAAWSLAVLENANTSADASADPKAYRW